MSGERGQRLSICFVTGNYPSAARPFEGTFVQQFVWAMARQGNRCTVIKPTSVFDRRYGPYPPRRATEDAGDNNTVEVLRPRYVSFSCRDIGISHTGRWTQASFSAAVVRTARRFKLAPDVVYGHFLYQAGAAAAHAAAVRDRPNVVGVGEGTFWTVTPFGWERAKIDFAHTAGFLAVASHIRDGLVRQLGVAREKILVLPNGVDFASFARLPREQARRNLGLDQSGCVAAFVGAFDDLKGGAELVEATKGLEGVRLVMLGQGPVQLSSDRIAFIGHVPHREVPVWLSAADFFVLPTKEEGSCNAVLEAMACGLPIITSNGAYMDDIVDDEVAIRVDPMDVNAIREAIVLLKNDPDRRKRMSEACLRKAKQFDINERARRVTKWMCGIVENWKRGRQGLRQ